MSNVSGIGVKMNERLPLSKKPRWDLSNKHLTLVIIIMKMEKHKAFGYYQKSAAGGLEAFKRSKCTKGDESNVEMILVIMMRRMPMKYIALVSLLVMI